MTSNRALEAYRQSVLAIEQSRLLEGFIGKIDATAPGGVVIDVPGRPGYVYVRLSNGVEVRTIDEAYNEGAIRNPNIKVRLERRPATGLVVIGTDAASAIAVLGERAASSSVAPHSHALASGNVDMVEGRRLIPGLLRLSALGGLYVYVEAFHYAGGYWPGGDFLMTPPATSGMKAWCAVVLDSATNTLVQVTGPDIPTPVPVSEIDLAALTLDSGVIPVGALVLTTGQTVITGAETWADFRFHFAQAGSSVVAFVSAAPASDTRNVVQPAGDHPALVLKNNASQTDAPFQVQNSSGAVMAQVSAAGGLTVNEQGADTDTRIEGDTDANLLFVDAGNDRVGIGTASPAVKLDVSGAIAASGALTGTGLAITGSGTIRKLLTDASTELTIASGAVTVTQTFHRIDTEADAASDDLATINGGTDGQFLVLRAEHTAREVVLTTAGNITTGDGNSVALDELYKFVLLIYDGNRSKWNVVGSGGSGGGGGSYYQTVKDAGTPKTQRAALNLVGGTDITLTIADDSVNNETDVTIAFSGSGSGSTPYSLCQGRLTLISGTPVTTADVTAATTLYFTPYKGNQIGLYGGSAWEMKTFSELSLSLSGYTANANYDIWAYNNAGTVTLESTVWTNDTTRATALTTQDGVYVKTGATTRRYLGTIRTTSTTGQTEDSAAKRFVWNYHHRAKRKLKRFETTASWTYSTTSWRQANNSAANQVDLVIGTQESVVFLSHSALMSHGSAGGQGGISVGGDSVTTPDSDSQIAQMLVAAAGQFVYSAITITTTPAAGRHYYAMLEIGDGSGTNTWYGVSVLRTHGIVGYVEG